MGNYHLEGMSRDELTDLLAEVMTQLRKIEAEDIKGDFITKSQRLRTEIDAKEATKSKEKSSWFPSLGNK
jgi:hypothetical protein